MSKRILFPLMLLALVFGLALAACSGGGGNQAAGGSASASQGNAQNGQKLFTSGKGNAPACSGCHSTQPGVKLVGPSLAGIGTQADQIIKDPNYKGSAKTAQDYIKESIVNPNVYVVPGFQPNVMYQNYGKDLTDQDVNDLVAYVMTLK